MYIKVFVRFAKSTEFTNIIYDYSQLMVMKPGHGAFRVGFKRKTCS